MSEFKWTFSFIDSSCAENMHNTFYDTKEDAEKAAIDSPWNYVRVFAIEIIEKD